MSEADLGFNQNQGGDPTDVEQPQEQETNPSFSGPSDPSGGGNDAGSLSQEEIEELRKRDAHAQEHIRRLEQEAKERQQALDDLQKELERRPTYEEVVERMRSNGAEEPTQPEQPQTTEVDEDKLAQRAAEIMSQQKAEEQYRQNLKSSMERAQEAYGENYVQAVQSTASELGMTLQEVDDMASRRPAAFERLFIKEKSGQEQQESQGGFVPRGSEQAPARQPETTDLKTAYRKQGSRKFFQDPDNFEAVRRKLNNDG